MAELLGRFIVVSDFNYLPQQILSMPLVSWKDVNRIQKTLTLDCHFDQDKLLIMLKNSILSLDQFNLDNVRAIVYLECWYNNVSISDILYTRDTSNDALPVILNDIQTYLVKTSKTFAPSFNAPEVLNRMNLMWWIHIPVTVRSVVEPFLRNFGFSLKKTDCTESWCGASLGSPHCLYRYRFVFDVNFNIVKQEPIGYGNNNNGFRSVPPPQNWGSTTSQQQRHSSTWNPLSSSAVSQTSHMFNGNNNNQSTTTPSPFPSVPTFNINQPLSNTSTNFFDRNNTFSFDSSGQQKKRG
jgi:hypothetical protein